jgi:hypothetical protein
MAETLDTTIHLFSEIDSLPGQEQTVLLKVIAAYIRGYKTNEAYNH